MSLRLLLPVLAAAAFVGAAPAPAIAGRSQPNPAPPGVPITLTCTDTTGLGCVLPSPCTWFTIHRGGQAGPIVPLGLFCPAVLRPVAPNGTFAFTWDQRDDLGAFVPPDSYWFEIRTFDSGFNVRTDWFCISIQPPNAPALTAAGPARVGMVTPLQVSAPQEPGALFVAALAFSANVPIVVFGLQTCLDASVSLDFLVAPIGGLDALGQSAGLALNVPNTPIALWQGAHVQSLIFGTAGLQLTNSVAFTVQP